MLLIFYFISFELVDAQTFQTTIGFKLPTYEDGVGGLVTNTGDFLVLGSNYNHPSGFFNPNGDMQLIWLNSFGTVINPSKFIGQDVAESGSWIEKAVDCAGNPGYIVAANQFGSGTNNMLITFTDLTGNPIWLNYIGLPAFDEKSSCVKQDLAGNFILVGTKTDPVNNLSTVYAVKLSCAGKLIWEKEFKVGLTSYASSVTSFAASPGTCNNLPNEYYITGNSIPLGGGNNTIFLLSLNANTGAVVFIKYYDLGPNTDDFATCIQGLCPSNTGNQGQLFLAGYTVDPFDFNNPKKMMILSTDLSGNPVWAKSYDIQPSFREISSHFIIDANNKLVLTGKAEETGVSDPPETGQCILMRVNNNGSVSEWTRIYDMGFSSHGNRVERTSKNEYFISGHSFTIPVVRQSDYDILAIKTDTAGKTNASCYRNANAIIANLTPAVTSSNTTGVSFQSLHSTILLVKPYQDKQVFCPFNLCDSLDLNADFNFASAGTTVVFTNLSSAAVGHNINSWNWDFGDGNTSNSQNPIHFYSNPGTYVVCLVISSSFNGLLCKDSICKDVIVLQDRCANVGLHAGFLFSANGNTYSFTDQSAINPNFSLQSWSWDFGDGNFSNLQNPTHTYSAIGNYSVCLIVTGGNANVSCKDTVCKNIQVPFEPSDSCIGNIVRNGGFDEGAIPGDLTAPGASNYWSIFTWTPQVVDFDFCKDSISMQMWGNQAVGEGLKQAITIQQGGIYQVSFCAKRLNTPYPLAQARFRAHVAPVSYLDYNVCNPGTCDDIFLSPVLTPNWVQYVSAPWIANQNYDLLTISVWNNYNTLNKAFTSWLRIDDICIEKIGTVANYNTDSKAFAKTYPNPSYDDLIVEFAKPLIVKTKIELLDINGQIRFQSILNKQESKFRIPMFDYANGIYFIRILQNGKWVWNAKVVKD